MVAAQYRCVDINVANRDFSSAVQTAPKNKESRCSLPDCSSLTSGSSQFWLEAIQHNGQSSYLDPSIKSNYKVFRNVVTDFGADNTGVTDASAAIQRAIEG